MAHLGKMITLKSGDGASIEYYHVEAQGARKGGLVCVMEIFGVTDHIKDVCDAWAKDGLEVISPALYDRAEKNFQASYSPDDIQKGLALRAKTSTEANMSDVQAGIDYLKGRNAGPVYVTGYCYGGTIAWVAACRCAGLAAAAGYYGGGIGDHISEKPRCPTVLHFGEHDNGIPLALVRKIEAAHPAVPVYVYDAGHGFQSDRRTDYNEACAKLAKQRCLDLFAANK
ncbi:MAG: dienelactone hydrolase family protein [Alphaproteobacteria bacterium]|nr:dienelactone hydrolase family protein [Alphaproteobacteria bacterium]